MGVDVWSQLKSQVYLGSDEFVEYHKRQAQGDIDISLSEVPKKQIREKARPLKYYLSRYKSDKKVGMQNTRPDPFFCDILHIMLLLL